jgi:DNA-binding CsgD family transcriptional regulator
MQRADLRIMPTSPPSPPMIDLIGHVYDAALDETLWAGTAARIARAVGSTSAVVKLHGADDQVRLLEATGNLSAPDPEWADHWHSRDLWVRRSVGVGLSRIVTSDQLVTPDEARRSGFYQEWLPALDIHHMIGAVFPAEGGGIGVLGVHRPADARGYDEGDRRAVGVFLPHLARALRVGQRLSQASFAAASALESLDAVDTGVVVADARGAVRHMNAVAEAMLARDEGLRVRRGRIEASALAMQAGLAAALRSAVATAAGRGLAAPATLRLDREGRAAWTLAAAPLRPRWAALAWSEPLALVLLRDPEFPPYRIDHLRALFGMTRMEALTAGELARGRSLEEIAAGLGVGLGTVRTHLKQVLSKTETRRQAEAVAVIARSVAALPQA